MSHNASAPPAHRRGSPVALTTLAVDVAAVFVFVLIGRFAHAHGLDLAGVASTAWPFLAGLAVGWLAARLLPRGRIDRLAGFVAVWLSTVALGMALRVVAGQGTDAVFCAVATVFLGLFLAAGRFTESLARRRWRSG